MLRLLKSFLCLGLLAAGWEHARAFSLLGPVNEPYQDPVIAYNLPGDIGAPKNLGEEYRWNTPVLYYAFDQNFLDYFGSNGVQSVEEAIAIYNALTNVSSYSADLAEFPLEALQFNYQAQALALFDLKSATLNLLTEQMGLAEPDRYTWTLHDRFLTPGGTCPVDMNYLVVKRNFDPVPSALDQLQASSYVNGTLYSYFIAEFCTGPNPLGEAVEYVVDPLASIFKPVASLAFAQDGSYHTGLTRDDVGGLRYLLRGGNMNVETAGPNTLTVATNFAVTQLLFTSNLTLLVNQALTNNAAQLQALYPNLVIGSTTPIYTNLVATNVFFYFTNEPWAPAGTVVLTFQTNVTTNVTIWFSHTFDNVITNTYYTNSRITVLETTVGPDPYGLPGQIYTNVTARTVRTNFISGDYYILPTNSACGVFFINTQLTSVVSFTNTPVAATNAAGATNIGGISFSQELVFHLTNSVYVIHPVPCISNSVALRRGVERIRFVRRDYDSLIGQFWQPITNQYTLVAVTNSANLPQVIVRSVFQPDILFTAQDLASGPGGPGATPVGARSIQYQPTNALPGLAGPGTLEPGTLFTYNKVGPIYLNPGFFFFGSLPPFTEGTHSTVFIWGSYDGSTNAPVVYPNGTSVINLENQVLIGVGPDTLPDGNVGVVYDVPLTAAGGNAPYVWSLTPGSPGLPPGLSLSPAGNISGTPTEVGTFDFSIRLTEGGARMVDRPYSITINP